RGANLEHFLASVAVLVPEVSEKSGAQLSDLVDALAATPDRGVRVVVDALDEAASDQDRREIAQAIVELAAVPSVRIAVASRPLTAGDNPCAPDGVLSRLGIREPNSPMLVD